MRVSTLNEEVVAWIYVLDAFEGGLPSASYLGVLADAAEAADAPADYVARAAGPRPCRSNFGGCDPAARAGRRRRTASRLRR